MASKTASLYLNIRNLDGIWTFARPAVSNNGRLKPPVAIVDKHEEKHTEAKYCMFWYEREKRRTKPVGQDPSLALTELQRHERKLEYLAAEGKVKEAPEGRRVTIGASAQEWIEGLLAEVVTRQRWAPITVQSTVVRHVFGEGSAIPGLGTAVNSSSC